MELLPFVVIIIAFWFLLIRPQQKRARQAREMQNNVEVGAKVMLTSGIYGEVAAVTDDYLLIAIAEGVQVKVVRNAIGQVLPAETALGEPAESYSDDTDDQLPRESTDDTAPTGAVDLDKPSAPETPEETLERLRKQGEN